MTTKTMAAIYENGFLKLEEPVNLEARTRVRVRIEIPDDRLEARRSSLTPENRALFDKIRDLRERGRVDFDVVEALRELREDG